MKTIIAGSRDITDLKLVEQAVRECGWNIEMVVSGGARGVDSLGEYWAMINDKPFYVFPADWELWGKRAGPIRNREMAEFADALIAIWDGKSSGTRDMIQQAKQQGLEVFVYRV